MRGLAPLLAVLLSGCGGVPLDDAVDAKRAVNDVQAQLWVREACALPLAGIAREVPRVLTTALLQHCLIDEKQR